MSSTYPTPSPAISSTDLDKEREKDDRDLSENFPEQTPYLTSNTDKNTHHHHHNHHPTTTEFHSIHHTVSAPGVTLDLEKIESHRSHLSHKKSKQQHDVAEKPNPESDPNSDEFVRRYSGFRWFLVCIAMYVVSKALLFFSVPSLTPSFFFYRCLHYIPPPKSSPPSSTVSTTPSSPPSNPPSSSPTAPPPLKSSVG